MPTTKLARTQLIKALRDLSNLVALNGEIHFKVRAYTKAVDTFEEMSDDDFDCIRSLRGIDGIGVKIAREIEDIMHRGTCNKLDILMDEYGDRLPLMEIKGIGAKTTNKLWDEYLCRSLDDLKDMVADGTIELKAVIKAVKNMDIGEKKSLPLSEAVDLSENLIAEICELNDESTFGAVEACGSIRRQKSIVEDISIIVEVMNKVKVELLSKRITSMLLDNVYAGGMAKMSGKYEDMQVNIRFASPESYGAMILYFTGPRQFNINMRTRAMRNRLRLNEYGLWHGDELVAGRLERDIFDALQMEYIYPEKRK